MLKDYNVTALCMCASLRMCWQLIHFCSYIQECPGGLCRQYKDCVECKSYSSGLYGQDECEEKCQFIKPTLVEHLEETAGNYK